MILKQKCIILTKPIDPIFITINTVDDDDEGSAAAILS